MQVLFGAKKSSPGQINPSIKVTGTSIDGSTTLYFPVQDSWQYLPGQADIFAKKRLINPAGHIEFQAYPKDLLLLAKLFDDQNFNHEIYGEFLDAAFQRINLSDAVAFQKNLIKEPLLQQFFKKYKQELHLVIQSFMSTDSTILTAQHLWQKLPLSETAKQKLEGWKIPLMLSSFTNREPKSQLNMILNHGRFIPI